MSRLSRRLVALLTAAALQACALLPAVHVHLASHHDDHATGTIHRHFAAHQLASPTETLGDLDDDHAIVWSVGSVARLSDVARVHPDTHVVAVDSSIQPVVRVGALRPRPRFGSTHDPPWADPSGLRGPPISRL